MNQVQIGGDGVLCNGSGQLVESKVEDRRCEYEDAAECDKVYCNGNVGFGVLPSAEERARADHTWEIQKKGPEEEVKEHTVDHLRLWYSDLDIIARYRLFAEKVSFEQERGWGLEKLRLW